MTWDLKPSVVVGCVALLAIYAWAVRGRLTSRALAWFAGVGLIFIALCSPLDEIADTYLFSVHMAKHIAFVLVVPALLLMGLPCSVAARLLRWRPALQIQSVLRQPAVAWSCGVGAMAIWHIPALFNAALASEPLHIVEHLSLLVAGSIYWWPLLSPLPESRMQPMPQSVAYLFTSCLACTSIGVLIAFAPSLLYPSYAHPIDHAGILPFIRNDLGISPEVDQQIGGLLMWVPGCMVYVTAIMAMFARWYGEEREAVAQV